MSETAARPADGEEAFSLRVANASRFLRGLAVSLPLLVLAGELVVVEALRFRAFVLAIGLALAFLAAPAKSVRARAALRLAAFLAATVACVVAAQSRGFLSRAGEPSSGDIALSVALLGAVIAAAWVSTGAALPAISLLTLAYVLFGSELDRVGLSSLAHRGYDLSRVAGSMVMSFEGVFGVPLDVAATTIGLFAIYGAVLQASGAARFFLDLSFALFAGGANARAAGRAVTFAGFLLGSVSGSGVATTLALGGASGPLLRRAGYSAERAGALLASAGIGALLSPPTLGAAAFLIAEFLKVSYASVLVMAVIPTLLYYFGVLLMIEADASEIDRGEGLIEPAPARGVVTILRQGGRHLLSPLWIVLLMAAGYSANRAALGATVAALLLEVVGSERALVARRLRDALVSAGASLVPVLATTACAGILVSGLTLTGLGLKAASLIVAVSGGHVALTILLSAVAVTILGLSVPVTASYILSAVTVAPALVQVGVNELAAHMFIFYYAVLSEVSPPTALSPMAAATLLGGDPYRTMMTTLRYTLPAFVVPLAFTMRADGLGLLLRGDVTAIALSLVAGTTIVFAASLAVSGRFRGPAPTWSRVLLGGLALALLMVSNPAFALAAGGVAVAVAFGLRASSPVVRD